MENFTNDSGWLVIWQDIKNGGTPLWIFLFLSVLMLFKPYIIKFLEFIGKIIYIRAKQNVKEYTIEDLKSHQLFKNLEFWLSVGIKTLKLVNIKYYGLDKFHKETEDYQKAKEEIAKDVLIIKFKTIQEYILNFINENSIEKLDLNTAKSYFSTYWKKFEIKERSELLDAGIPKAFLRKYFIYEKATNDLLLQTINSYFDDNVFSLNIETRVYLALSAIDNYLTDSYNNMVFTVSEINGDLNGAEYKGHIIGERKTNVLRPPHPTFVMQVNEIINKIMCDFNANRVSVLKYYEDNNGILYHSTVYECCDVGILPILSKNQKIPTTMEGEALSMLKNGTVIAADISKFNSAIASRLSDRGSVAVILIPMFEHNKFTGIILLDYFGLDKFEKIKVIENLDDILMQYSQQLVPFISYPSNYNFC